MLNPCKPKGDSCTAGDECCDGFCQPVGPNGELVCSDTPPGGECSQPSEKCMVDADCCDPTNICLNGFCTLKGPA